MERINQTNFSGLLGTPPRVLGPSYDRANLQTGIVHLGIGAFHRAHQAYYTEAVLNATGGNWGIIGCSLRSAGVRQQLSPQDGLYTLVERGPEGEKFQLIGAVKSVMVGPEDPPALVQTIADPTIKVVSLTVTEKGYCHDPATGDLNLDHPDIQHDLAHLDQPKSAVGVLVAALNLRKLNGARSFTALSCDNLPNNGDVFRKVVLQFAAKVDLALAQWIDANTSFPNSMIDRIVPATTEADRDQFEQTVGYRDEGIVLAEPFTQWVIEDKFCDDRPAWESVGVLLVKEVAVFEAMKLRLLNGCHSTLAYCGYLSGFETISDVMKEPAFVKLATVFMAREAGETVTTPPGFDISHYKAQLRERFANPALKHRTWQIAMDGSQKLPQRLLNTVRDQLNGNKNIDIICLAVAAWIRYVSGVDERGEPIDVRDPMAARLQEYHERHQGDPQAIVQAIVGIKEIFGHDLQSSAPFVTSVSDWLTRFYADGVLATIRSEFGTSASPT